MKLDYKKLGLKCGLEIHQQLDTKKLFMNTDSIIRDDTPDFEIRRKLRAVIGESGEVDEAASFAANANKTFIYQGYTDSISAIECDEEPPRVMNVDALNIVLQISSMLQATIVDEVQIMRKTVVDGSNTSGFQRTALVGRNASMKSKYGHIGIPMISIEEDAAKIVSRDETTNTITYNLSRLGIPLIEIGTDPDITTPEMAKDVAAQLGMILRSTGRVKRGLGTIRQDLNVSITGGARVEIKGAQDLKMLPKWTEYEVLRQINLLQIRDDLKKQKISITKKQIKPIDLTTIFLKTKSKIISQALASDGVVYGIKLSGFAGFIGLEVQPGRRLGTEFSDYGKASAGVKGLIHSDEDLHKKYSFTDTEILSVRKKLGCKKNDAFVLVASSKEKVLLALDAIAMRAEIACKEIPKEVRKTNPDGTTSFMRPMPGAARMYPETDCVPIPTHELTKEIIIPELITDKAKRYEKEFRLSADLAMLCAKFDFNVLHNSFVSFDIVVNTFKNCAPSFLAQTIVNTPKEIKKRFGIEFAQEHFKDVFVLLQKVNDNEISKDALIELLPKMIKGGPIDYSKYKPIDEAIIEKKIIEILKKHKGATFGALMGIAMKEFRGKVDGKKISEFLKKHI